MTLDETINKLTTMKLHTLARGLREIMELPPDRQLAFEDQLGLLVDQEWTERENRKVARRIQEARLSTRAVPEEILCDAARGLERSQLRDLTTCQWVKSHHNVVILGATGVARASSQPL